MTNLMVTILVKQQWDEAIANVKNAASAYGMRSRELQDAITARLEAEDIVDLYDMQRECGITYGNVWD
jgi:hypothetical protein